MKTITVDINGKQAIAFKPSETDVLSLCVGDVAPDCFGKLRKVTRLYAAARDVNGKAFVCYYTECGNNAMISNSIKQDEILITIPLSNVFTSAELSRF
jgi:hypothetical protein